VEIIVHLAVNLIVYNIDCKSAKIENLWQLSLEKKGLRLMDFILIFSISCKTGLLVILLRKSNGPVVQWIEWQIPVLLVGRSSRPGITEIVNDKSVRHELALLFVTLL
jgi:hypothetical protein